VVAPKAGAATPEGLKGGGGGGIPRRKVVARGGSKGRIGGDTEDAAVAAVAGSAVGKS